MASCRLCGRTGDEISSGVQVCTTCLDSRPEEAMMLARDRHEETRRASGLVPSPPHAAGGRQCRFCANECRVDDGGRGFCGLREVRGRHLSGGVREGNISWYYDPLPTNCVADWVCAGGTGAGFPRYARKPGPERGYHNLAVFSQVCSFDCVFCQNGSFRRLTLRPTYRTAEELAGAVDGLTSCICFFGGDPGPQMPFLLRAARLAREARPDQILRICWETNGSFHPTFLDAALDLSLSSGGCLKVDLKALSPALHVTLTGNENTRTLENFSRAARRIPERPEPPPLVASTLLVPGYVGPREVRRIATFIAALDPGIPYSLLGFAPHLYTRDLPPTPRAQAKACYEAARDQGLSRVRLANMHLLTG